jgi:Zn-dependent protease with chaperone function
MTPDAFFDCFTDSSYFDRDARPKSVKALLTLCERLPDEIINEWPRIVVFAPDPNDRASCVGLMPSEPDSGDTFIYLAPLLEELEQAEVDFTVAHEFAHAALRHHLPENMGLSIEEAQKGYLNWDSEIAADKLAQGWGFTIPESRKRTEQ